jgi:hypothetical protein
MPDAPSASRLGSPPWLRLRAELRVFRARWIGLIVHGVVLVIAALLAGVETAMHCLEIGDGHPRANLRGLNRRMPQHFLQMSNRCACP